MTVSKIDESYIDEITQIESECFSDPWSKEQLLSSLNGGIFLGAFEKDKLCGYIGFYLAADCCEILNLCVKPGFRQNGVGKKLLFAAEQEAVSNLCSGIYLELRQANTPARSLYEKSGYVFDGIRKKYYQNPTEDAILMHKDI